VSFNMIGIESNAVGNTSVTDSDLTGAFPVSHVTPAWGAGVVFYIRFRGVITASSATALKVNVIGNAGGGCTAKAGSMIDLYPVVAS
jgi:hypothetical protein